MSLKIPYDNFLYHRIVKVLGIFWYSYHNSYFPYYNRSFWDVTYMWWKMYLFSSFKLRQPLYAGMESSNVFIFIVILFTSTKQIASSNEFHCQCSKISIQDKDDKTFKKQFNWYSHEKYRTNYKERNSNEYLVHDQSREYWTIRSHHRGSDYIYRTRDSSVCPSPGDQTWHSSLNTAKKEFVFVVKCNGFLGYLGPKSDLICDGSKPTYNVLSEAIRGCTEMKDCVVVRQWHNVPTLFHETVEPRWAQI